MNPKWSPGPEHEQFTEWAQSQGIIAKGVGPARFPGRGLGMVAKRDIEKGEAIVTVPRTAMVTIDGLPESFTGLFPEGTPVHAVLAAFFTNGDPEDLRHYDLWRKTWPSRRDFESCMPLLWPACLRGDSDGPSSSGLLPPSISSSWRSFQKNERGPKSSASDYSPHQDLLPAQETRLRTAWTAVLEVFPETDWDEFSYHWLVVNTRSFFYLMPGRDMPEDHNDAMALLPFADYFNHSDVACNVKFDGEKYVFWATKPYNAGEEIYMSYGNHPNDFLFAEYGFYLDENASEALYLDDIIFKDLDPSQREELEFQQYYGNYQLTASGVCFRTEIAACIKYMAPEDWRNYVLGYSTQGMSEAKSEAIIRKWVRTYVHEAEVTIAALQNVGGAGAETDTERAGREEKVEMLRRRWVQIGELCRRGLDAVSC
ncbi:ribosomal N-lysine methyltransferase [Aspergillus candidus]|uniref:Ribosomal N-lysine methyltransferase n=1 Tax=Aspergillus candidus TaxID=41067 RepID=A0A2I2F9L6_ASPCN|nr:ribosomal N-lysine methyltransferase [Aspergillus candidus]PLB37322.1 ribosomal N-lysine methyltransferase [Aspergillus candidus]